MFSCEVKNNNSPGSNEPWHEQSRYQVNDSVVRA